MTGTVDISPPNGIHRVSRDGRMGRGEAGDGGEGGSEGLVMPQREVSFGGGGARRALVHALGAGALVLLFGARAGGDGGRGGGRGAGLLLKVCYDHGHIAHRYGQLLGSAAVNVLQLRPGNVRVFVGLGG